MVYFSPLKNCPACRYSLRGLPTQHQCPECGKKIADGTIVIRPARAWMPFSRMLILFLCMSVFLLPYLSGATSQFYGRNGPIFVEIFFMTWAACLLPSVWTAFRDGFYLLLDEDGIELHAHRLQRRAAWGLVQKATPVERTAQIVFSESADRKTIRGVFESPAEARAFCNLTVAIKREPTWPHLDSSNLLTLARSHLSQFDANAHRAPSNLAFILSAIALVAWYSFYFVGRYGGIIVSGRAIILIGFTCWLTFFVLILAGQWFSDPRRLHTTDEDESPS